MTKPYVSRIIAFFMVAFMISSCEENDKNSYGKTSEAARMEALNLEAQIQEIEELKIGRSRADVMELFKPMGGFAPTDVTYFQHKENPFIKIKVRFDLIDKEKEKLNPEDRIVEISKPYLEIGGTID